LAANVGVLSIEVTADDGNGGTVSDIFEIAVAAANQLPTVLNPIPNQAVSIGNDLSFIFSSNTFSDPDGNVLAYTARLSGGNPLPSWILFNPSTRKFSGSPSLADLGTVSIEVIANDGNGGTISTQFDIVVTGLPSTESLIHYWNFNVATSLATLVNPTLSIVGGASIDANNSQPLTLIDFANGTGQNFSVDNLNARNGDPSGNHLRYNNPIAGQLTFSVPTTGYKDLVVKFATRRSGSGAGIQIWTYSIDGINFNDTLRVVTVFDANPKLEILNFSQIPEVNNNSNFKLRVSFVQGTGGLAGNNRFDNFTVEGAVLVVPVLPPGQTTLVSPIQGAPSVSILPTLKWNKVQNATSYLVEVSSENAFSSPNISQSVVGDTTFTVTSSLSYLSQYFWRVKAINLAGDGPWSGTFSFSTEEAPAPILIAVNEIMASNVTTIQDEDGTFSDWIELYNFGTQAYDLSGFGLSDSDGTPYKWVFPSYTIQPGQYLLVWASSKNRINPSNPLHTNFAISSNGEPILLTSPTGILVSRIDPLASTADISRGRFPNGTGPLELFNQPTPGTANISNGGGPVVPLVPPVFSVPPGFYQSNITLNITHPDPGAVVRYTLDGSEPTESSPTWTGAQTISDRSTEPNVISLIPTNFITGGRGWTPPSETIKKATVIRAKAFKTGGSESPIETATYFVLPGHSYSLPVVSIVTNPANLFDENIGLFVPGVNYVPGDDATGNYYGSGDLWERPASMEMYGQGFDFQQNIAIRINGNFTRRFPQKSIRIYAKGEPGKSSLDYPIFQNPERSGFQRMVLRNFGNDWGSAMMRDVLSQSLVKHLNLDYQHFRTSVVFINGEYWGMYNFRERYDKYYLQRIYGVDPDNIDYLENKYLVSEGDNSNYLQFIQFFENNDLSQPENYEQMGRLMDIDNFTDYFVTELFVNNNDWPTNNIEYWRARVPYNPNAPKGQDGRWRWILKDLDRSFGRVTPIDFNMLEWATNGAAAWGTSLFRNLLKNEQFKNGFINRMADQLNSSFKKERMLNMVDSIKAIMEPEVPEHIRRWNRPTSMSSWENEIQVIRNFINVREGFVRQHFINYFGLSGNANITLNVSDQNAGQIKINSLQINSNTLGISGASPYPWTGLYFKDVPIKLQAIPNSGFAFSHWILNGAINNNPSPVFDLQEDLNVIAVFVPSTRIAVSLVAPQDNTFNSEASVNFQWTANPGASSYRIQVSRSPGMNDLVTDQSGITGTSYLLNGLADDQVYYWWIISTGQSGQLDWSPIWKFSTGEEGTLDAPTLSTPTAGAIDVPLTTNLSWLGVFGAVSYDIQVSKNQQFSTLEFNVTDHSGTNLQIQNLAELTTYFWRVRAKNLSTTGNWSTVRSFATLSTPNAELGLIGYWKFDEGSGNAFVDFSGNGNNASIQSPATLQWIPGVKNLAVRMNGTKGSNGSVPNNPTLNIPNQITIAVWVRPNSVSGKRIISKTNPDGFELGTNTNGKFEFRFNRESNGTTYRLYSNQNYPTDGNTWVHVAATFDGQKSTIYINGELDNQAIYGPTQMNNNSSDLQIGSRNGIDRWSGDLDELKLYSRALSGQEIKLLLGIELPIPTAPILTSPQNESEINTQTPLLTWGPIENATKYFVQVSYSVLFDDIIFESEVQNENQITTPTLEVGSSYFWRVLARNESGDSEWSEVRSFTIPLPDIDPDPTNENLVGHWKMDEGSGNQLLDASGKNNHASISSASSLTWVTGKYDLALRMNGTKNSNGVVPNNPTLNTSGGVTISVWVRPNSISNKRIISKTNPDGFELGTNTNGKFEFRFNRETNSTTYRLYSNQNYPTNGSTWVHVAATFNGTKSTIYINGVEDNSATYAPVSIIQNSSDLQIGARNGIDRWSGDLDELMLFNKALTATEIAALYNVDLPSPTSPGLISPANGTTNLPQSISLAWQAVALAESYQVQVSTANNFSSLVFENTNVQGTETQVGNLTPSTTYFWRVLAKNGSGSSGWSPTWSFTTGAALNTNLVGHWLMNEGGGNILIDQSAFGNNANFVNNSGITWVTGKESLAVRFNGLTGRFARVAHNESISMSTQLTIAVWIKPTGLGNRQILSKAGPDGFELSTFEGGQIEFRINRDSNGSTYRLRSNQTYPTDGNTWMHVVAVFNGSSSSLYINGVLDASANYGSVQINPNTADLQIGARNSVNRWIGDMDDLRLYKQALGATQVQQLYQEFANLRISSGSERPVTTSNMEAEQQEVGMKQPLVLENTGEKVILYPNPVEDVLTIQMPVQPTRAVRVSVYDTKGNEVFSDFSSWDSNTFLLDMSGTRYIPGLYLVMIWEDGQPIIRKVMKK
jgi:hypothetical protein